VKNGLGDISDWGVEKNMGGKPVKGQRQSGGKVET